MFVASYSNTMRNARFKTDVPVLNVRTIQQIRAEKMREAAEARKRREEELAREREEAARAKEVAERELKALKAFRCIDVRGDVIRQAPEDRRPAREIIDLAAKASGVSAKEILGPRRSRHIVEARFDAIKAVAEARPDLSLPQIGRIFGRDHTTILHALRMRGGRSFSHKAIRATQNGEE